MIRLYRALLHLYPASFRIEYGEEMSAVFAERLAGAGSVGAMGLLLREAAAVISGALALHRAMLAQDLGYTVRTLRHSRGFALTAILVTALGVGANTAAFSVAEFVLLRPLPFPEPQSLVRVCEGPRSGGGWGCMNQLSPANYRDLKALTSSFRGMGAFHRNAINLVGEGEPQRLTLAMVTPELLPLLQVRPVLGRVFDSAQGGDPDQRTVVIAYGVWQAQYGGDPGVLGRTLTLNGFPHEVIGVMPPGFHFPSREVQLWTPLVFREEDYVDRTDTYIEAVARLQDRVSMEEARADLILAASRLSNDYPETNAETGISFFRMRDEFSPRYRVLVLALCGAGICILILTCANLAGLLLARAAARERELAVRAALGAGRERLTRQLVTESAALALAGGAAGLVVAVLALPLLAHLVPSTLPISGEPTLDWRVLLLAGSFTALTGLGFGLFPAFRAGRTGFGALRDGARAGGGRRQRLRSALVSIEVAMSVVLLISSGLLIRAVWRLQAVDPGFRAEGVFTLRTALPRPKYDSTVSRVEFYDRVLTEVRALPGVASAAYITGLPMAMTGGIWGVALPGVEVPLDGRVGVSLRFVTPQFFRTLGIPLVRGRDIEDGDRGDRPHVAVVSESFTERLWPNQDPIGKTFWIGEEGTPLGVHRTVVGVVRDIRVRGRERSSEPQLYLPAGQVPPGALINYDPKDLVIRFAGETPALLSAVRRIVHTIDPEQPVSDVRMLEEIVAGETAGRRAQLRILGALAVVALLLAGVGIHGLLAYTVSQRSQEIGVRLALGAAPSGVAGMVLRDGMRLALIGLIPGVLAAYLAGRGMSALLFGVEPSDPATLSAAVGLVLLMAFAGSLLPALVAVRVSPMSVIRSE